VSSQLVQIAPLEKPSVTSIPGTLESEHGLRPGRDRIFSTGSGAGNRGLVSLRGTAEGFLLLLVVFYPPIPTYKENNANDGLRN